MKIISLKNKEHLKKLEKEHIEYIVQVAPQALEWQSYQGLPFQSGVCEITKTFLSLRERDLVFCDFYKAMEEDVSSISGIEIKELAERTSITNIILFTKEQFALVKKAYFLKKGEDAASLFGESLDENLEEIRKIYHKNFSKLSPVAFQHFLLAGMLPFVEEGMMEELDEDLWWKFEDRQRGFGYEKI